MPGYHSVLPRVFPWRIWLSKEQAENLIDTLLEVGHTGFALTEHPSSMDGHVHLWLSAENAEYVDTLDTYNVESTGGEVG